jgi:hypothetical protein
LKYLSLFVLAFIIIITACGQADVNVPIIDEETAVPITATTSIPTPTLAPTAIEATATAITPPTEPIPTETAVPTEIPTASPTPITDDLALAPDDVFFYPIPPIYTGDQISIQVFPQVPDEVTVESVTLHVYVDGNEVAVSQLGYGSLASRPQAVAEWVWQVSSTAGSHEIQVTLDQGDLIQVGDENPDNNTVIITLPILASASRPVNERNATWATAESDCCTIHVVSGTSAYRDLPELTVMVETAVKEASHQLNLELEEKLDVFFVDRVIGQGGYAGSGMVLSYLDRQYSGGGLYETLVHESIHVLDQQIAPQRISFLAEGTAVWGAGGHYKPEGLDQRAAALVAIGEYIPLAALADDFYPIQHEIGYLEAGGLVKYLIDTYGWSVYQDFYSNVTLEGVNSPSEALDQGIQAYYGKSLSAMESEWRAYLADIEVGETEVSDLSTTIRFYNVMRQYQTHYDPTAHFLAAWLPNPYDVIEKGNPADLTGHPQDEVNITLETMLLAADQAMREGDYNRANILLDSVTRVLESDGAFIDPLAINYLNIVRKAEIEGYEAQQINLNGSRAELIATKKNSTNLDTFRMMLQGQDWVFTN